MLPVKSRDYFAYNTGLFSCENGLKNIQKFTWNMPRPLCPFDPHIRDSFLINNVKFKKIT